MLLTDPTITHPFHHHRRRRRRQSEDVGSRASEGAGDTDEENYESKDKTIFIAMVVVGGDETET